MRSRRSRKDLVLAVVSCVGAAACQDLPRDEGQIWSCFGLVNETLPGPMDIPSNLYFGGCSPEDPGMQIVAFARPEATQDEIVAACDTACGSAFQSYWQGHADTQLPLHCQTLFAAPCSDPALSADTSKLASTSNVGFFSGGPADYRTALSGSINLSLDGDQASVPGTGILDTSYPACAQGQTCNVRVSRFDSIASESFSLDSFVVIDLAQVQMQGPQTGVVDSGGFSFAPNSVEVEANFNLNGQRESIHSGNAQALAFTSSQRGNVAVNATFGTAPRTAQISMSGIPEGSPPIAAISPPAGSFECTCSSCTPVTVSSAATDPDGDLQNLSWLVDGQVFSAGDQDLSLQLGIGQHQVKLVATDSRGAATSATAPIDVVDTTPPVLTIPPDVTFRSCDFPVIGTATATDTCSQAYVTNNDPGSFNIGTNLVTWTAFDEAGNRTTAVQRVTITQAADTACCPPGYHVIVGTGSGVRITGTSGNDCIIGTDGNDTIDGGGGDDYIIARGGQDIITGGPGNDVILAGDGDDSIDGGDGNDLISCGPGQQRMLVSGGLGNDVIRGGTGDDQVQAGDGDDTIIGGDGQDTLDGQAGNDIIAGGNGDNHLIGGDGNDVLTGGPTRDTIEGNAGIDSLFGADGDDSLQGGAGDDLLEGGPGHNQCIAGGGNDRFVQCEIQQ